MSLKVDLSYQMDPPFEEGFHYPKQENFVGRVIKSFEMTADDTFELTFEDGGKLIVAVYTEGLNCFECNGYLTVKEC